MNVSLEKKETPLSVLSFSCGGIYANEEGLRLFRLHAMTAHISSQSYDLVALQECWMQEDFEFIKNDLEAILSHSHYFKSCGLVVLSKYPIISSLYTKISNAGIGRKFFGTDYLVEEGCGHVRIGHIDIETIDFFSFYMSAPLAENCSDIIHQQRRANCSLIYKRMQQFAEQGRNIILAGNFRNEQSYYSNDISSRLIDCWSINESNYDTRATRWKRGDEISAEEHIQIYGVTFGSPLNTFTNEQSIQDKLKDFHSGVELLCFYASGERHDRIYYFKSPRITCQQSRAVMKEYIPYTNLSYSDHFGVHSVFSVSVYVNQVRHTSGFVYAARSNYLQQCSFKRRYEKYNYDDNFWWVYDEWRKNSLVLLKLATLSVLVYVGYRTIKKLNAWLSLPKEIFNTFKKNVNLLTHLHPEQLFVFLKKISDASKVGYHTIKQTNWSFFQKEISNAFKKSVNLLPHLHQEQLLVFLKEISSTFKVISTENLK